MSNSVLSTVPSPAEVRHAISLLQRFIDADDGSGMDDDFNPVLKHSDRRLLNLPSGCRGVVFDAFQQLQMDPAVEKMVASITSDKALWDAVLDNKLVRQLRRPLARELLQDDDDEEDPADLLAIILSWISNMIKLKIVELVDKFNSLVDDIFESAFASSKVGRSGSEGTNSGGDESSNSKGRRSDDDKLNASVQLSIIILLIVVLTRASS